MELGAGRRWARVARRTAHSRRWASVRAGRARRARQAGVSGRFAQGVLGRAGRACWGEKGGRRTGAGGRPQAGGRALGAQQAGAGRAGRARPGLVLGSALGALVPFLIRFDSFFFS